MKCVKCKKELDNSKTIKEVWSKEDEGSKYPWNKIGSFKEYSNTCECGFKNQWIPF